MKSKEYCNCCGKKLNVERGIVKEDTITVLKDWGYFSRKDGKRVCFTICEACYDKIASTFVIPVEEEEITELL